MAKFTRKEAAAIRSEARRIAAAIDRKTVVCACCGYSDYVEVAHVKPVCAFATDERSLVNALDNLIFLCPNHHKALDHTKNPVNGLTLAGTTLVRWERTEPYRSRIC